MRVAILGLNEFTLVALDALQNYQHESIVIIPWDGTEESLKVHPPMLNELNFGYPGVQEQAVTFHVRGERRWEDVRAHLAKAGWHAFEGVKPLTSSYQIFAHLTPLIIEAPKVQWAPAEETLTEVLEREGGADVIINVLDRFQLCGEEDHSFIRTKIWWSDLKGPRHAAGNVIYNTEDSPSWSVSSNINGRQVTIWDQEPPFDDIYETTLPTKMTCSCEVPEIGLHLGTEANYRVTNLARAYEEVVDFLSSPISKINYIEEADTIPQEAFRGDKD